MNKRTVERIKVSVNKNGDYEAAATIIATLAWPEFVTDTAKMKELQAALCQWYLQLKVGMNENWANTQQFIKPIHMSLPSTKVERVQRSMHNRLGYRLHAVRVVLPFLKTVFAPGYELPDGIDRLSVNEVVEHLLPKTGQADAANFKSRIWRPSRSVIHIATALYLLAQSGELSVWSMFGSSAHRRLLVGDAEEFAEPLTLFRGLNIQRDKLICLELT